MSAMLRIACSLVLMTLVSATISGCVMSEEVKRIERDKAEKKRRKNAMSTNLSGKQIFIRSCNTCHPGGKQGMGPSLANLKDHFPTDEKLRSFIRQGAGIMPPQPKEVINDAEMDNLLEYLRKLKVDTI